MNYPVTIQNHKTILFSSLLIAALINAFLVNSFGVLSLAVVPVIAVLAFIIVKPLAGILLMGLLYPFTFIGMNDIGYMVFMNLFRIVTFFTFFVWLTRIVLTEGRVDYSPLKWFFVLLLVGSLLASIRSNEFLIEKLQGIKLLKYGMYVCLFLLVYNLTKKVEHIRGFILVFLLALFTLSVLSYLQYFLDIPIIYDKDPLFEGLSPSFRLFVGIGINPNHTSIVYIFGIPFILNLFIHVRGTYPKTAMLLLLLFFSAALLLTQSRSAIFGIIAAQIFIQSTKRRFYIKHLFAYMLIGIGFYLLYAGLSEFIVADRFDMESIIEHSIAYRLKQFAATIKLAFDHPFGAGREYFELIEYYGGYAGTPHNIFLKNLVETGFLGFMGYTGLILVAVYILWKIKIPDNNFELSVLRSSLLCGLIAYVIHNQVHNFLWEYLLWIFLAISMSLYRFVHQNNHEKTLFREI